MSEIHGRHRLEGTAAGVLPDPYVGQGQLPVYTVTFDRIGEHHDVPPITVTARDANHLAEQIHDHARPRLGSKVVHVVALLDEMRGYILVGGCRPAGTFTIEHARTAGGVGIGGGP